MHFVCFCQAPISAPAWGKNERKNPATFDEKWASFSAHFPLKFSLQPLFFLFGWKVANGNGSDGEKTGMRYSTVNLLGKDRQFWGDSSRAFRCRYQHLETIIDPYCCLRHWSNQLLSLLAIPKNDCIVLNQWRRNPNKFVRQSKTEKYLTLRCS